MFVKKMCYVTILDIDKDIFITYSFLITLINQFRILSQNYAILLLDGF